MKKLWHHIGLFNHGLFPISQAETMSVFAGKRLERENLPWTTAEDEQLIDLAVRKYDHRFGDCWLYISSEMNRTPDEVETRFNEKYLKSIGKEKTSEVVISKSFRPLLMNRQFRIIPPQCYIVPSESNFPPPPVPDNYIPQAFRQYLTGNSRGDNV